MGANYDMIIAAAELDGALTDSIGKILSDHNFYMTSASALDAIDIDDASVILISPPSNQYVQIVANHSSLAVPVAEWFGNNCLAAALSRSGKKSFHLWSLDSGFVAGYSAFQQGMKVESDIVFSNHANDTTHLMDGVPTPAKLPGNSFGGLLAHEEFNFRTHMEASRNLEIGLGEIISLLGFGVHLVDFFDAVDDQEGMAIKDHQYKVVRMSEWTAICFSDVGPAHAGRER